MDRSQSNGEFDSRLRGEWLVGGELLGRREGTGQACPKNRRAFPTLGPEVRRWGVALVE
jgi:hypothetical protein